jgi:hypothetical protein
VSGAISGEFKGALLGVISARALSTTNVAAPNAATVAKIFRHAKTFRICIDFPMHGGTSNAKSKIRLALTSLVARSSLIDDVNAALAADQLAVAMTALKRFKRVLDLHVNHRSGWPIDMNTPPGFIKTAPKAPIDYRHGICA